MVDWYDGLPTKSGQYLITVEKLGHRMVTIRCFSKVNGWGMFRGETILAWTFLPQPWNGEAFSRNPYIDPASVQEQFEQAVREQLKRQAELIRQRKEAENGKGEEEI